jgi:hypothetical protein
VVEGLPGTLQELVQALEQRGFTALTDDHYPARNSRYIELINPSREAGGSVRIEEDRGLWSVGVEVAGEWRDPYAILLALDGQKYATRASSHEDRRRLTLKALDRMPPASELQPLVDRLREFDREYWRRLGVEEPSEP